MPRKRTSEAAESRAKVRDEAAQEHGPSTANPVRRARGYVYATHPVTGRDVVFKPGEALPDYAHEGD